MIRNFCIIAHIDHGKSTLADRMLEITKTVEARKMREQFLDMHPLERERGITIKMQPVTMRYKNFILNLIDTPGHIDFNYEVSRALAAVEGAILLVDATQGVEAQTISNVELARNLKLKIIPVVNKIDLPQARISETKEEIKNLLGAPDEKILEVSARTGEGVEKLLEAVISRIPSPALSNEARALIFDFDYSLHRGVIAHARVFGGEFKKGNKLTLFAAKNNFTALEVGVFKPELQEQASLASGEIGYIITGIKGAKAVRVGDTIGGPPLPGYKEPRPVVFSSLYPADQDKFEDLKKALESLKLLDSSFFFEEESSGVLGRGFRCGFLGMLHLEIVVEKLKRDFLIEVVAATPTVRYKLITKKGEIEVYSPAKFPPEHEIIEIWEPYLKIEILAPPEKLSGALKLLADREAEIGDTKKFSTNRFKLDAKLPLRELMRDFFDELKSISSGYASLSYEFLEMRKADLVRLDVLIAEEPEPAFSKIITRNRAQKEAEETVEKLYKMLPRALFALKIQAAVSGRILASRALRAMAKDVTGHLYGGDRARKMKLWKKQKEGKKKLRARGDYQIPPDVFLKMIRK